MHYRWPSKLSKEHDHQVLLEQACAPAIEKGTAIAEWAPAKADAAEGSTTFAALITARLD